jgi:hypothetical protein
MENESWYRLLLGMSNRIASFSQGSYACADLKVWHIAHMLTSLSSVHFSDPKPNKDTVSVLVCIKSGGPSHQHLTPTATQPILTALMHFVMVTVTQKYTMVTPLGDTEVHHGCSGVLL